jgi:hypothetical protein
MKKTLSTLFLLCVMLFSGSAFAQGGAYQKGDKLFNAGFSFGAYNYKIDGTRSTGFIPVSASLEFGVHESISVGPYIGYGSWEYYYSDKVDGWGQSYSYTAITKASFLSLGGRASWHYLPLLNNELDLNLNESKFDFYATVLAGIEFRNSNSSYSGYMGEGSLRGSSTHFAPGVVLGFKYLFTDKIGAYLETGRGALGYGTLGITAKF